MREAGTSLEGKQWFVISQHRRRSPCPSSVPWHRPESESDTRVYCKEDVFHSISRLLPTSCAVVEGAHSLLENEASSRPIRCVGVGGLSTVEIRYESTHTPLSRWQKQQYDQYSAGHQSPAASVGCPAAATNHGCLCLYFVFYNL